MTPDDDGRRIDRLFRTAARSYSTRVIGVLLTGAGDDGVVGLRAIPELTSE
jgi:chemotaxis response regulator CheB